MDGLLSINDLKALQELILPKREDEESEDEKLTLKATKNLGPGDIGRPNSSGQDSKPHKVEIKSDSKNIWSEEEATTRQTPETIDPRQVPEYEIKFKQAVTAEDVFLGIGFKTPASASCEWLSIYIKLPGEEHESIELDVESDSVDIRSPKYRLHLPTSHSVDPNSSSAKWHSDRSTLELTLRMVRELDAVNF